MIKEIRTKFNAAFTDEKYSLLMNELNSRLKYPVDFRVAETPIFLTEEITAKLKDACGDISSQVTTPEYFEYSKNAIPAEAGIKASGSRPHFLQIDFALAKGEDGGVIPQLIELQAFPTLYAYQYYLDEAIRKIYDIPAGLTSYFSGLQPDEYVNAFKNIILGGKDPENVVLLEIEPEQQKTRIDFAATEELTGIKTVCITKVYQKNGSMFYKNGGREIKIERIYNRVIFDELYRKDIKLNFNFTDDIDVEWTGHPEWFFRISKYSLPYIKSLYAPECYFLKDLTTYPADLNSYVLKPLFSFAGLGVEINLTEGMLNSIGERNNYILQKKIEYAPIIETPDGYSKVEIRMMFLWDKELKLVNNLVRMSKGKMMGVDFNKNKTWVGSSLAYHY